MPFNKLDDSTSGKIRPRFKLATPVPKDAVMQLVSEHCQTDETVIHSTYDKFIKVKVPLKERHYWSPVLHLTFEREPDRTLIRCLIGPEDQVWTLFTFFYVAVGITGFFGSMFALTQWQLKNDLSYIFILPVSLALLTSIYFVVHFGRVKAHTQMLHLLRTLRSSVDSIECERVI